MGLTKKEKEVMKNNPKEIMNDKEFKEYESKRDKKAHKKDRHSLNPNPYCSICKAKVEKL